MLAFEEIYDRLYQFGWSKAQTRRAQDELTHLSDEEWFDWVEYRRQRQGKSREEWNVACDYVINNMLKDHGI